MCVKSNARQNPSSGLIMFVIKFPELCHLCCLVLVIELFMEKTGCIENELIYIQKQKQADKKDGTGDISVLI